MKLYEYLDSENKTWGPITEAELDKMPRDTFAREQGTVIFRPRWFMLEKEAKKKPEIALHESQETKAAQEDAEASPEKVAIIGLIVTIVLGLLGGFYGGILASWIFWAGISGCLARSMRMAVGTGYLCGGILGPLGVVLTFLIGVARTGER